MKLCSALVLLACAAASACSKDDTPTPVTPTACNYTVSTTSQAPASEGGTFNVVVTKSSGSCSWSASSNASWMTFSGASTGADSGTLNVVVTRNDTTVGRSGAVTVTWNGGTSLVAVNQNGLAFGDCRYSFASPTQTVSANGGFSSAPLVVTGSGCSYALAADAAWLTLTASGTGTTSEPVGFNAMPNPDAIERAGSITASYTGGSTKVTITQAGVTNCTYTLSPASQDVPGAGGSFGFVATRNTQNGCSFAASTTTPWITFTGPTTGLSGATVSYAVQPNATGAARSGAINVIWSGGNVDFAVTQQP